MLSASAFLIAHLDDNVTAGKCVAYLKIARIAAAWITGCASPVDIDNAHRGLHQAYGTDDRRRLLSHETRRRPFADDAMRAKAVLALIIFPVRFNRQRFASRTVSA